MKTPRNRHTIVIRSTYSTSGGVERVALSTIRGLLDSGDRVTLLTMPHQQWPVSHQRLTVVELGVHRTHRLVQAWSFNRAVLRYLRHSSADCIFSLDKVARFTHLHAGGGTHKTYLNIRNQYSSRAERLFRSLSLFHRYILHLEKRGFKNPMLEKVRCNSQLVVDNVSKEYGVPDEKLVMIHSGIRWQAMASTFDRREVIAAELRERHQLDPAWRLLLFLGSGFRRKGLDIAILGLSALPASYHLLVVGKGGQRRYRAMADHHGVGRRIHFIGSQADGWRYAAACQALVLPSHYDPFGGAAAEGHAMGIPVLVSDRTGYADRVIHGENGVVLKTPFRPDTVEGAFRELLALIESPKTSPVEIRRHARYVDDDEVLQRVLEQLF